MSGNEAVRKVRKRLRGNVPMYKLIMMDFSMQGMDGPTTARKIRKLLRRRTTKQAVSTPSGSILSKPYPKTKVLICCCSAYGGEYYERVAQNSGMDLFIQKPLFKD